MKDSLVCLVVENRPRWQEILKITLETMPAEVFQATDERGAHHKLNERPYDLIVTDLALEPGEDREKAAQKGMSFVRNVREDPLNRHAAIIILTAYPTLGRFREAYREMGVFDLVDKGEFDNNHFPETVRSAVFNARVKRGQSIRKYGPNLRIRHSENKLNGWDGRELIGGNLNQPIDNLKLKDWADTINSILLSVPEEEVQKKLWRKTAEELGEKVFQEFFKAPDLFRDLVLCRERDKCNHSVIIEYKGPIDDLVFPYELVKDNGDYFCFNMPMKRKLVDPGSPHSRKTESLGEFISSLQGKKQALKFLLVGMPKGGWDSSGKLYYRDLPNVEEEVVRLEAMIKRSLNDLGITPYVEVLVGRNAKYEKVAGKLKEGYHFLHFTGHGTFNRRSPESSGPVLWRGVDAVETLRASHFKQLVSNTALRFVFLNCCMSALTGEKGRGDFRGVFGALVKADVPIILGHSLVVDDKSAAEFAVAFYSNLWRHFCPEIALHQCRRDFRDRDNALWAAPILVDQTSD